MKSTPLLGNGGALSHEALPAKCRVRNRFACLQTNRPKSAGAGDRCRRSLGTPHEGEGVQVRGLRSWHTTGFAGSFTRATQSFVAGGVAVFGPEYGLI
jgi:hypothetical protein